MRPDLLKKQSTTIFHKNLDGDVITPDKIIGEENGPKCKIWIKKAEGKQVSRIEIDKGFDWATSIKPLLPGTPDWCPSTHFGYLESGEVGILTKGITGDESIQTINKGETYYIQSGHIPIFYENTVMIEFSQDETYTNENFVSNTTKTSCSCFSMKWIPFSTKK
tara:strand:+ start:16545 stop:17036 length:492 start_codon:yes stop_codon:yes gene_type:complete